MPAISNGMTAPLNDVALAAFGMAAIFAWTRLRDRPSYRASITAGLFAGLAMGVKYPALVLFGLLAATTAIRVLDRRPSASAIERPPWARLLARLCRDSRRHRRLLVPASLRSYRQSGLSVLSHVFWRCRPG